MIREDSCRGAVYGGEDSTLVQHCTDSGRGGDLTVGVCLLSKPVASDPFGAIAQTREVAVDGIGGLVAGYRDRAPRMLLEVPAARSGFLECP